MDCDGAASGVDLDVGAVGDSGGGFVGAGLGSLLLAHTLGEVDRNGGVAYLESSSPLNVPLYERFGFEVIAEIQAGDSPTIWPMLRPASARSTAGHKRAE